MTGDKPTPSADAGMTDPWSWRTWFMRHGIFAATVGVGLVLNHFVLSERKENRRAESVQKLQAGDASYELLFHAGYNTVTRNGERVFDTRESGAGICLRLRVSQGGGIEAECYGPDGQTTEQFPIP